MVEATAGTAVNSEVYRGRLCEEAFEAGMELTARETHELRLVEPNGASVSVKAGESLTITDIEIPQIDSQLSVVFKVDVGDDYSVTLKAWAIETAVKDGQLSIE